MLKLIIHRGVSNVREFQLQQGKNFIGRDFANDFKVDDPSVSGTHAQITVNGGRITVRDLSSTNGTFIDDAQVVEGMLEPGHKLRLGAVEMSLVADAVEYAAPLPAAVATAIPKPPSRVHVEGVRVGQVAGPERPVAISASPAAPAPASGLKVSGLHAAPPPAAAAVVESPPMPPPVAKPAATSGASLGHNRMLCKFHPKSLARWQCSKCGQLYCDLCVTTRKVNEGSAYFCRPCGAPCSPVAMELGEETRGSFFKHLPGAFLYPFQHDGPLILVVGTAIFVLLRFVSRLPIPFMFVFVKILIGASVLGYTFAYMQNIIMTTIGGDEKKPDLPDTEELRSQGALLTGTILACFSPVIGLALWKHYGEDVPYWTNWAMLGFFAAGCFYLPMALLGVAVFNSVAAVNPVVIVPPMMKLPVQYLFACIALGLVVSVRWMEAGVMAYVLPIPIVTYLVSSFIGLYFLTVQSRILGLLYYCNYDRFGWFK